MTQSDIEPSAFLLLSITNATLHTAHFGTIAGTLNVESLSVAVSPAEHAPSKAYLILRMNQFETVVDPQRVVHLHTTDVVRTYLFDGTDDDPSSLVLRITTPLHTGGSVSAASFHEEMETFDSILSQFADFRRDDRGVDDYSLAGKHLHGNVEDQDMRGHLILVNQANGEVVGQVDERFHIHEDESMNIPGREGEPIVIDVGEDYDEESGELGAYEAFARSVPPEEHDWITKSASTISRVISGGANLVVSTITSASSSYIAKTPTYGSGSTTPIPPLDPDRKQAGSVPTDQQPYAPPLAIRVLTSPTTRAGLEGIHTLSGHARTVSSKTVGMVDNLIRKAMGSGSSNRKILVPKSVSASHTPPSYTPVYAPQPVPGSGYLEKPPLPRRPSSAPPYDYETPTPYEKPTQFGHTKQYSSGLLVPPMTSPGPPPTFTTTPPPLPPRGPLTRTQRFILSADLILSTLDESTKRLLDTGTEKLGEVMGHRYGPQAAQSSLLMAGTAKNVVLVYVDVRGVGRRALLRTVGKEFVKGRVMAKGKDGKPVVVEGAGVPVGGATSTFAVVGGEKK